MHFWMKLKPMLPNAFHLYKNLKSCAHTLSTMQRNNVFIILKLFLNNLSPCKSDAQKNPFRFYFVHTTFLFQIKFCLGYEPPCFLFWISKLIPILFTNLLAKKCSKSLFFKHCLKFFLAIAFSNVPLWVEKLQSSIYFIL